MRTVQVVIVNYRTAGLVIDCLRSLAAEVHLQPGYHVTVVENGSGDGSREVIEAALRAENWAGWVDVVPVEQNRGFAAGNNAAIRPVLSRPNPPAYVLLLNPDTVVRPGAVRALVEFMATHPGVGIAGSRLEGEDGTPQRSAFRFPGIASELERGLRLGFVSKLLRRSLVAPPVRSCAHPADWVAGASMMIRREVFASIGLLDEDYFLYYEETDFCLRARRAGWPCWYVPESRVVHLVGQSSGIKDGSLRGRRIPAFWLSSRRQYFSKNYGDAYRFVADVSWTLGFSCWRLRRRLQRKPDHDPPCLLEDFVRHSLTRPKRVLRLGRTADAGTAAGETLPEYAARRRSRQGQ